MPLFLWRVTMVLVGHLILCAHVFLGVIHEKIKVTK